MNLTALAERLYDRRAAAVFVPRIEVHAESWRPRLNGCHQNVAMWQKLRPGVEIVRGWTVADYRDAAPAFPPHYKFFAHSVIRTERGDLADITPNHLPWEYPFLPHDPADGDFDDLVQTQRVVSIIHLMR